MIGLILDKLQCLIDAQTKKQTKPLFCLIAQKAISTVMSDHEWSTGLARVFVAAVVAATRHMHPVVSHWQVTRSRTLRLAGHFCSTVKRLIDRVEYKKMRPSLYWPYCSACITT